MLKKVITQDIPRFDRRLTTEDIDRIRMTVDFIGRCPVEGVNYTSTAANVGMTKYKAERCIDSLERSFILTRVQPTGMNVPREPKVLMQLSYRLIHQPYAQAIGALREEFFLLAAAQHGFSISYAKTTRGAKTLDYALAVGGQPTVVEIGGKGRGRSQFKGLQYVRKMVLAHEDLGGARPFVPGERVPLFCVGFALSLEPRARISLAALVSVLELSWT
ncbi:MAG: hypothetical protein RBU30_05745 [Polyangia bacterium]|jgi:predicted AAA+ superfamily ATPase|nr:hypothetical protein [Polyangia bacterium]